MEGSRWTHLQDHRCGRTSGIPTIHETSSRDCNNLTMPSIENAEQHNSFKVYDWNICGKGIYKVDCVGW